MAINVSHAPNLSLLGAMAYMEGQKSRRQREMDDIRRATIQSALMNQQAAIRQQERAPELALRAEQMGMAAQDRDMDRMAGLQGRAMDQQYGMARQQRAGEMARQQQMRQFEMGQMAQAADDERRLFGQEEMFRLQNPEAQFERAFTAGQQEQMQKIQKDMDFIEQNRGVTIPPQQADELLWQKKQQLAGISPRMQQKTPPPTPQQLFEKEVFTAPDGRLGSRDDRGVWHWSNPPKPDKPEKADPPEKAEMERVDKTFDSVAKSMEYEETRKEKDKDGKESDVPTGRMIRPDPAAVYAEIEKREKARQEYLKKKQQESLPKPKTPEEISQLNPGTNFVAPDGTVRIVPERVGLQENFSGLPTTPSGIAGMLGGA